MNPVGKNSWLVPLADLSLILFIVTGATLAGVLGTAQDEGVEEAASSENGGPENRGIAQGVASSVFSDVEGGPRLADWLRQYSAGPGEQLTIEAFHMPQDRGSVTQRIEVLAAQAIAAGEQPRIIIQPANETRIMAIFAHDRDPQLAQR